MTFSRESWGLEVQQGDQGRKLNDTFYFSQRLGTISGGKNCVFLVAFGGKGYFST